MTDFYIEYFEREAREKRGSGCIKSVVVLCIVSVILVMLFWLYTPLTR